MTSTGTVTRGVEAAVDQVPKAFEKADGEELNLVRGRLKPAAMRLVARDPIRRIVIGPVGVLADVDPVGGPQPKKKAEDLFLPPGGFGRQRHHGRSENESGGKIGFAGLGQKTGEQGRAHTLAIIINLRVGMAAADERKEGPQIGKPILDSREITAPRRNRIIPLPAQFEGKGDDAVLRQMTGQRFVIERRAAEPVHGDDNRARALVRSQIGRPQRIGKSLAVGRLPLVLGAGGGHRFYL
jgi:hypothetical protein